MSDMEKDLLGNPEESQDNESNELEKELGELKDLFQKELDKASEEQENDENQPEEELIQQLDEAEEAAEQQEEEDRPLCQCCEEKPCSASHGEDYPYCDDCRKLMIKYPIRFTGVLAFILTIVLFIGGFYLTQDEIMDSVTVLDASTAYASGHITTAYTAYSQYFSAPYSKYISKRAVREAVKVYMKLGATNEITALVEENYSEDELNKASNKEIKEIYDFCTVLNNTTDAVYQSIVMPALYGYITTDDAIASLNKFIKEIPEQTEQTKATATDAQESEPAYDRVIAEYFIYYLMVNGSYDNDVRYEQIKKVAELGGENYTWMYASSIAMMAAEMGDFEAVEKYSEIIKENNLDDVSAYTTVAHYYFKQDKIDTAKIIEVCKLADEAFPSGSVTDHCRYYAAAYLIEGEYEKALEAMEKYTVDGIKYQSDANLYALCGLANGKTEVYDEMVETLNNYNYEMSKYVEQYKKGKITIEEIFKTAGGDFI